MHQIALPFEKSARQILSIGAGPLMMFVEAQFMFMDHSSIFISFVGICYAFCDHDIERSITQKRSNESAKWSWDVNKLNNKLLFFQFQFVSPLAMIFLYSTFAKNHSYSIRRKTNTFMWEKIFRSKIYYYCQIYLYFDQKFS